MGKVIGGLKSHCNGKYLWNPHGLGLGGGILNQGILMFEKRHVERTLHKLLLLKTKNI